MAYDIECRTCRQHTWASNIVVLLNNHTSENGRFICQNCKSDDTFIFRESKLQEEGEVWQRWIKGVIKIETGILTYSPYIFLTADSKETNPNGLHFHYFKDTRSQGKGKLKHGHGPGGPPVLDIKDMFTIIKQLVSLNLIAKEDVNKFLESL